MQIQPINNQYNQSFGAFIIKPEAKKIIKNLEKLSGNEIAQYDALINFSPNIISSKYYDYVIGVTHNIFDPKMVSIEHYITPKEKNIKYLAPISRGHLNEYNNEYELYANIRNLDNEDNLSENIKIQGNKETLEKLDTAIASKNRFASLRALFEALEKEPTYIQNEINRLRKALFKI